MAAARDAGHRADYKPASIEVKLAAVEAENKRRNCLQTPLEALRDDSST